MFVVDCGEWRLLDRQKAKFFRSKPFPGVFALNDCALSLCKIRIYPSSTRIGLVSLNTVRLVCLGLANAQSLHPQENFIASS
jgi:hypothetical protein